MSDHVPAAVVIPPSPETAEAAGEAAVAVAEAEGETAVRLAEIQAETTLALAEAGDAETERDVEWLVTELAASRASQETLAADCSRAHERIAAMEGQIASLTETMTIQAAAISLLTPPAPLETPPAEVVLTDGPPPAPADAPAPVADPAVPPVQKTGRKRMWL